MKAKIIRDSVHGYISIPEDYINKFIDTECFQRLRNVEQTSMRCLYPCARHDRFTHSIGTFHIGRKLIQALRKNLEQHNKECYNAFTPDEWKKIVKTFEIACLLHDCAHAPFSHVIEKYMDSPFDPKDGKAGLLVDLLSSATEKIDSSFSDKELLKSCTSNHEKASSLLLWEMFKNDIDALGANPIWAMRMILGYTYTPTTNLKERVLNCIFSLLNGAYMDADKLDYIVRDTASSGIDNFSVDLKRLIDSVTIVKLANGMYSIGYLKTSINVIQNMISAKNNLYLWVYAHHKVQYYSNLLCKCFEKAIAILFDYKKEDETLATCSHIISVDAMLNRITISANSHEEIVFLPCDADILSLIKKAYNLCPNDLDFNELFSRRYKKSVWKSYAEFKTLFNFSDDDTKVIFNIVESRAPEIINSICERFKTDANLSQKESWAIFNAKAKLSATKNSKIYVQFENIVEEYSRISNVESNDLPAFFYLYFRGRTLTNEEKASITEIITSYIP